MNSEVMKEIILELREYCEPELMCSLCPLTRKLNNGNDICDTIKSNWDGEFENE